MWTKKFFKVIILIFALYFIYLIWKKYKREEKTNKKIYFIAKNMNNEIKSRKIIKRAKKAKRGKREKRAKKNIILDIDHTLIHTVNPLELAQMESKDLLPESLFNCPYYKLNDLALVFQRPHLSEFLDFLFANYNVAIWSAGSSDYVNAIVDTFIRTEKRIPSFVMTRDDLIESGQSFKDLDYVYEKYPLFQPYNTLIIDDLPDNVFSQVDNSILIPPFNVFNEECMNDNALLELISYLREFKNKKDIRALHDPFDIFIGGLISSDL